jgi:hypothetical protein
MKTSPITVPDACEGTVLARQQTARPRLVHTQRKQSSGGAGSRRARRVARAAAVQGVMAVRWRCRGAPGLANRRERSGRPWEILGFCRLKPGTPNSKEAAQCAHECAASIRTKGVPWRCPVSALAPPKKPRRDTCTAFSSEIRS